jgi:ABC-2 type transport system ATP-binding protein
VTKRAFFSIARQAGGIDIARFWWGRGHLMSPVAVAITREVDSANNPDCRPERIGYAVAMTQAPAICLSKLGKTYANGKIALKAVDLDIPRGSMFGLLGPNGAGKSTIINILAGLVNKTSGTASVWGFDIDMNPRNAKVSIGVVPQELVFDAFFTPLEVLELQAGLYGIKPSERRSMEILKAVRLDDKAHAYARTLSGGMKRRLLVAKAMVHGPPILVLDEPTAGVDIELRQQLWAYVRQLNKEGVTVVLTTHYLEEAQELCDRIAIINHGEVIANTDKISLMAGASEKKIVVTVDKDMDSIPKELSEFQAEQRGTRRIVVTYDKRTAQAGRILTLLNDAGYGIADVSTEEADLEDVFMTLTSANNLAHEKASHLAI